jgi:hypothetical protein
MRSSQRGVTLIGWVFLLVPLAVLLYAGIRLTPMYLNYMRVARSLEQVASENEGANQVNPQEARSSLEKHFDIESIEFPTLKDIDIHREGEGWVAIADYEDAAPLFANISLVVAFRKEVRLR